MNTEPVFPMAVRCTYDRNHGMDILDALNDPEKTVTKEIGIAMDAVRHATILFANLSATVEQSAEQQCDAHHDLYHRKYDRYRVNDRRLVATVKY